MRPMTSDHPRWTEFIKRLEGPEGCDFKENDEGKITWSCKGGTDKSFAISILKTMQDIDIPGSVRWFDAHGGYCDCEIVFNCG